MPSSHRFDPSSKHPDQTEVNHLDQTQVAGPSIPPVDNGKYWPVSPVQQSFPSSLSQPSPLANQPYSHFNPGNIPNQFEPENQHHFNGESQKKNFKRSRLIVLITLLVIALLGAGGFVYWKFFYPSHHASSSHASLSNGVSQIWKSDRFEFAGLKAEDSFEPYTLRLDDKDTIGVIGPGKNGPEIIILNSKTGKKAQNAKTPSLPACDFKAGKLITNTGSELKCVDKAQYDKFQGVKAEDVPKKGVDQSADANPSGEDGRKAPQSPAGEMIYANSEVQIRVAPENGQLAKQVLGYSPDGKNLLWIEDLPDPGLVTVQSGTVFVTTQYPDSQEVKVQALVPNQTPAQSPDPGRVITKPVVSKDAIKELDISTVIFLNPQLYFAETEDSDFSEDSHELSSKLEKTPKVADNKQWIQANNGGAATSDLGPSKAYYRFLEPSPDSSVLKGFQEGEYADLNGDGYLDRIVGLDQLEADGAMLYLVFILDPADPSRPYQALLHVGDPEGLEYKDGVLYKTSYIDDGKTVVKFDAS